MRDYVTCQICGMNLDSDFAARREIDGINIWFCSDIHAAIFNKEAM